MIAKRGLRDLTRSQNYLIPAMFSRKDIVVIDAPESGKTTGCLMALVSLLRATNKRKVRTSRTSIVPRVFSKITLFSFIAGKGCKSEVAFYTSLFC